MDTTTICAAYLHDSCDFGLTLDEIEKEVSSEVRQLVENTQLIKEISKKYNEESFDEEKVELGESLKYDGFNVEKIVFCQGAEAMRNSFLCVNELDSET